MRQKKENSYLLLEKRFVKIISKLINLYKETNEKNNNFITSSC